MDIVFGRNVPLDFIYQFLLSQRLISRRLFSIYFIRHYFVDKLN